MALDFSPLENPGRVFLTCMTFMRPTTRPTATVGLISLFFLVVWGLRGARGRSLSISLTHNPSPVGRTIANWIFG
jgi:hypothetical protein